jgi:hypothetical protein
VRRFEGSGVDAEMRYPGAAVFVRFVGNEGLSVRDALYHAVHTDSEGIIWIFVFLA